MTLKRQLVMLIITTTFGAGGCIVDRGPSGGGPHQNVTPDPAVTLGSAQLSGYHVSAGSDSELPGGTTGFVVTANGAGGYRLTWSDASASTARFSGTITCDSTFDPKQLSGYSGNENITLSADDATITFDSVPGIALDGVDLVSGSDPIYVDLQVDGDYHGFDIFFTGARSSLLQTSDYDPVAFTSP